jgi:hypothetical protein
MQPERPPRGNNSLSWTSYSSAYFLARAKMTKHNSSRWRLWAIEKKEKVVAEKKRAGENRKASKSGTGVCLRFIEYLLQ